MDAYTWSDLKTIVVDKYFYDRNLKRLRFTLAHELGHILLHREVITACPRNSVEDYQKYVGSIGVKEHKQMESQADCFAGLVLVPPIQLAAKFKEAQALGLANGLSLNDPTVRAHIADWISDFFVVSAGTVDMRLCYDDYWPFKPRKTG